MALKYQDLLQAVMVVVKGGNVPNIVGEAGIGKTALVNDLAQQNGAKLFTTVVSLAEKGDLSIPVPPLTSDSFIQTEHYGKLADVQFGYSHTLIQIIEFAEAHPERPIYWFLDEFNRGSQGVQSELMNLVLQRSINSLRLPSQVHIIIAENPDATMTGFENSDYSVMSGDNAIKDRTVRLVMKTDFNDWLQWAEAADHIHPQIIDYLKQYPEMLSQHSVDSDLFPTPRSWQRLSDNYEQLLKLDAKTKHKIQLDVFAGDIGLQVATDLNEYLAQQTRQLNIERLFQDKLSDARDQFQQLNEVEKITILQTAIKNQLQFDQNFIAHLGALLPLLNPDGQYACAMTLIDNQDALNAIYQRVIENDQPFVDLYVQLEKIGFDAL